MELKIHELFICHKCTAGLELRFVRRLRSFMAFPKDRSEKKNTRRTDGSLIRERSQSARDSK